MTRHNTSSPEETRKSQSRPGSQHGCHVHTTHSQPRSPHATPHKTAHKSAHHSHTRNPSPLIMVTTSAQTQHSGNDTSYYFVPDTNTQGAQVQGYRWMEPIIIDDDDLMFGGKSLSAWYEEERKSLSMPAEEERRGRQRVSQLHTPLLRKLYKKAAGCGNHRIETNNLLR